MIMSYFYEGRKAFQQGLQPDDNPYPSEGEAHKSWEAGYDDGWYADTILDDRRY